ncbi:MAG: hypothetical protein IJO40_08395 [Thermoguttaceae bacterium]|nr:hypothetical protein [Thermoguttaceae bacterium]
MKKNANFANKRNRRRRNAFALPLAALLGAALFALPTDAAKADDFGFSLNLGCFSLNIGNNDDCCDHVPPIVVAPPKPAPRPIVVAPPKPAPRPIVVAPPKPAPRPIVVAPAKPAPRPGKAPQIAARPNPNAVVRGQAPSRERNARATYPPLKNARAPRY